MESIYQHIVDHAEALAPELTRIRRDFHQYAESGWLEIRTSSLIAQRLTELGYQVLTGPDVCKAEERMGLPPEEYLQQQYTRALEQGAVQPWAERAKNGFTGVIGILDCGEGPVIGMRFDIDALGVFESHADTHFPYREGFSSVNEGMMHACGHDGHAAMGLGVAEILISLKEQLHGKVKLIFQPAEEGVRGARSIAASGQLDDIDYMLGNHIWVRGDTDEQVGVTTGTTLATTKLDVWFEGKACHAGAPDMGDNAMLAAATAVLNMHAIPRHRDGMTCVNVGTLQAGSGRNVVCDRAKLELEVRGATTAANLYMEQYARRIVEAAAQMHGCRSKIELMGAAESVVNDEKMIERCLSVSSQKLGLSIQAPTPLTGGSEDYAYMANRVRAHGGESVFFYTLSPMAGSGHSPSYDFDESILPTGVKVFCGLACDLMGL